MPGPWRCKAEKFSRTQEGHSLVSHTWFPDGSDGKESTCNEEDLGSIPGLGRSLEKEMATHFSILAWKVPCMEEPDRLQSMGSQRVRHKWVTWLSFFKEGHENWIEVSRCEVIDANWDFASGKWFYQNLTKDGLAFRDVGSWKAVELFQKWLSTLTAY